MNRIHWPLLLRTFLVPSLYVFLVAFGELRFPVHFGLSNTMAVLGSFLALTPTFLVGQDGIRIGLLLGLIDGVLMKADRSGLNVDWNQILVLNLTVAVLVILGILMRRWMTGEGFK